MRSYFKVEENFRFIGEYYPRHTLFLAQTNNAIRLSFTTELKLGTALNLVAVFLHTGMSS